MQAASIDSAHAPGHDRDAGGAAQHQRIQLLARLWGVLLGVVEHAERAHLAGGQRFVVEQHARRDQWSGEAAPPGLVGACDEANAKATVKREQPPPAAVPSRAAPGTRGGAG